jgi:UDP-glucose 4-epimerase
MRHCCVIGGRGFIGSHIVEKLTLRKRQITVIGRKALPSRKLPESVHYVSGDYGKKNFLMDVLRGVDEVIQLAYASVPKTSFENPLSDIRYNLPATVKLFEVAGRLGVNTLVLVSSGGTVYGNATKIPIPEEHPTNPISPYGITKLATEKYALMFNELEALPIVCVRPSNAYGDGQRPFVHQGFVATAMASILQRKKITIFGEPGTIRDYIHVSDVANGIIAALDHGKPGALYNVGSGVGRSNQDVLAEIFPLADEAGFHPSIKTAPPRPFDVPVNVLDSTKLFKETGWKPRISFPEGINKTWQWFYEIAGGNYSKKAPTR